MSYFKSFVSSTITHPTLKLYKKEPTPGRAKPPVVPLPLHAIISMGHEKVIVKGWISKDVGVLEGGAKCP